MTDDISEDRFDPKGFCFDGLVWLRRVGRRLDSVTKQETRWRLRTLLGLLVSHCNQNYQTWVGQETLEWEMFHCHQSRVSRDLKMLQNLKIISVQKRTRWNLPSLITLLIYDDMVIPPLKKNGWPDETVNVLPEHPELDQQELRVKLMTHNALKVAAQAEEWREERRAYREYLKKKK